MLLMALDHTVVGLNAWPHGTGRDAEADGQSVRRWNSALAYTVRSLTHLCAPGFTFLLGLGVVYFGAARARLGWPAARMARHFAVRGLVLLAVTAAMGPVFTAGYVWFLNIVLFALAVDYVLAGLAWLAVGAGEASLARALAAWAPRERPGEGAEEGLLEASRAGEEEEEQQQRGASRKAPKWAGDVSWHVFNALLVALAVVTIWWNIWFSPTHGRCQLSHGSTAAATTTVSPLVESIWFRIWFYPVEAPRVISGFPPLAWISFAVLGLVYGRVLLARPWSQLAIAWGNMLAGLGFLLLFILTRILRFGNLSEGCLQTPEQQGPGNPYLQSPASFFYIVKYPPDVAFWAFTMAINLFLLGIFGFLPTRIGKRFTVLLAYGTSALFYYVVHIAILLAAGAALIRGFRP